MNNSERIQECLTDAGYETQYLGDVICVRDPIHTVHGKTAVVTEWRLQEMHTVRQAIQFLEERGVHVVREKPKPAPKKVRRRSKSQPNYNH